VDIEAVACVHNLQYKFSTSITNKQTNKQPWSQCNEHRNKVTNNTLDRKQYRGKQTI